MWFLIALMMVNGAVQIEGAGQYVNYDFCKEAASQFQSEASGDHVAFVCVKNKVVPYSF